jgi:acyl carrier protein
MTAEVFVANPLRPHDAERVYRSGDIGALLPDGSLRFLGRRDNQVKVQGVRVELGEIENALLAHPQVSEAVVLARHADIGATTLHAYVVLNGPVEGNLRAYLATQLSAAMLPQDFTALDAMPMTSSGKIDRKALAARDAVALPAVSAYVAPVSATEQAVAALFGQVLGRDKVSLHDDFFAIGGHSLRALMLLARIRNAFRVDLPLRALFEAPTVAQLAAGIDELLSVLAAPDATAGDEITEEIEY